MSLNFFTFFRNKERPKDLAFLDVSYLRHDPTSQTLMVYNNEAKSVRNVRLVVINKMMQSFKKDFDRLDPLFVNEVPLDHLTDSMGLAFKGAIKKVLLHYNNINCCFETSNNKFRRLS